MAFSGLSYFGQKRVFGFLRIFTSFDRLFFSVWCGGGGVVVGGGWGGDNYAHKDFRHGKLERILGAASLKEKLSHHYKL